MQERLEFEPVEHTDYVFEIIGVNWVVIIGVLVAVAAGVIWIWRSRDVGR